MLIIKSCRIISMHMVHGQFMSCFCLGTQLPFARPWPGAPHSLESQVNEWWHEGLNLKAKFSSLDLMICCIMASKMYAQHPSYIGSKHRDRFQLSWENQWSERCSQAVAKALLGRSGNLALQGTFGPPALLARLPPFFPHHGCGLDPKAHCEMLVCC